jgi:hypothetical protein
MSFDVRKDSPAVRSASLAFVNALLADIMPHLTLAARGCGYALAVHGSKCRDIDLLAVPWVSDAQEPDLLVRRLVGVLAGFMGRSVQAGDWSDRPHGRRSATIILPGMCPEIDLSVMPLAHPNPSEKE